MTDVRIEKVREYYDLDPRREWERFDRHRLEFPVTLHHLLRHLGKAPLDILDLGGGPGRYSLELASRGHRVTLADLSPANLDFARQQAATQGIRLRDIVETDARELGRWADANFDAVLCFGPLYHLSRESDRARVVDECLRVLKPGGLFACAFISPYAPIYDLLRKNPGGIADYRERLERFLAPWGLRRLEYFGAESMLAQSEGRIMEQGEAVLAGWIEFAISTASTPAGLLAAEHLVYIGRKTGMAGTTPKPFCRSAVCAAGRAGGPECSRLGPSVFIHGPDLLVDTPEEIAVQLNRSCAPRIAACLYSHWHPDHTAGLRVFEMNKDWTGWPPQRRSTKVVLTESIAKSFRDWMGLMTHFDFLAHEGLVELVTIGDRQTWETGGWRPDTKTLATRFDLVYLPLGVFDQNPFTGERNIHPDHPILQSEQTVAETLAIAAQLDTERVVLSHIEEPDGINLELGSRLGAHWSGLLDKEIQLAHDTQTFEI